jgi:protoporphyrinogen oxidase
MTRDVVVIGGGLSGLAAAYELSKLGIGGTLIEVKPRLGGSILTQQIGDFLLDGGPFVFEKYGPWPFLADLGLRDALTPIGRYRDAELVIFKAGTQTLVDALIERITLTVMTRMAVSSIGPLPSGGFGVCLENGLLLDARALIIAVPARYADHMLRSLAPEAALRLFDYRYDPVVRVSLGCRRADLDGLTPALPTGGVCKFFETYDQPTRVPIGHVLVRAGVRLDEAGRINTPDAAVDAVRAWIKPAEPVLAWAHYWPEADPLTCYLPEHADNMDAIDQLLPERVALVGSDYRARRLDQQVEQGRAAARKIAAQLTE